MSVLLLLLLLLTACSAAESTPTMTLQGSIMQGLVRALTHSTAQHDTAQHSASMVQRQRHGTASAAHSSQNQQLKQQPHHILC